MRRRRITLKDIERLKSDPKITMLLRKPEPEDFENTIGTSPYSARLEHVYIGNDQIYLFGDYVTWDTLRIEHFDWVIATVEIEPNDTLEVTWTIGVK